MWKDELLASQCRRGSVSRTSDANRSIDEQLRFAIANKRLIQLRYHGHLRVAEPHDYGVQKGTTKLLIYQVRGPASAQRSDVRGWRLLEVSKIDGCLVLEETFPGSRGPSHQHHYVWDVVYARVG
jgi:hypothetical protein